MTIVYKNSGGLASSGGGGGTTDHQTLNNRDVAGTHPATAITAIDKNGVDSTVQDELNKLLLSVGAGSGINVDVSDPRNPIISAASSAPTPRQCAVVLCDPKWDIPSVDTAIPLGGDRSGVVYSVLDNAITGIVGEADVTIQGNFEVSSLNGRVREGYQRERDGVISFYQGREVDVDRGEPTALTIRTVIRGSLATDKYRLTLKDDGSGQITGNNLAILIEPIDCSMI